MFSLLEPFPWTLPALVAGLLTGLATFLGTRRALHDCDIPRGRTPYWFGLFGTFLGAFFVWAVCDWGVQSTPEVHPSLFWWQWRIVYHLSLIALLLIVTATDLKSYFVLDWCCWLGIGLAVLGALVSGEFQLVHVWVDWNQEIPQLQGPYLPQWLKLHQHWHGLAWSLAGLACGAIVTWLIRWLSALVLARPALGSGDVLIMAMVGAYLGWQPTIVVLLLAPVLALTIGGLDRLRSNHPALPYGPFLALAAILVLFSWRFIWMAEFSLGTQGERDRAATFAVRRFFGDPVALLLIAALSVGLLLLLLGLLRLYHMVPAVSRTTHGSSSRPPDSSLHGDAD